MLLPLATARGTVSPSPIAAHRHEPRRAESARPRRSVHAALESRDAATRVRTKRRRARRHERRAAGPARSRRRCSAGRRLPIRAGRHPVRRTAPVAPDSRPPTASRLVELVSAVGASFSHGKKRNLNGFAGGPEPKFRQTFRVPPHAVCRVRRRTRTHCTRRTHPYLLRRGVYVCRTLCKFVRVVCA